MTPAGVLHALVSSLAAIPPAEWGAVVLALAYLLLALRQDPWCWARAIASAAIYLALFAQGGLVMQAVLQVFYMLHGGLRQVGVAWRPRRDRRAGAAGVVPGRREACWRRRGRARGDARQRLDRGTVQGRPRG